MPDSNIKVLYVDDEENNLISFRAYFRKDYEVYTASSAAEALRLLDSIDMQIIVSDQRMPHITGIEFLERTIVKHPDSIRLLITGQADIDTVIAAINQGQISKYLQKPWDWEKFRLTMENCVDLYNNRVALRLKNEELIKTNDELNRFVYSASHDLRSPLMSVLGVVQLAKMEDEMKVAEEYFDIIETSVLKLDKYIKNIIDYYQNSRSDEMIDKVNFEALANDVIDSLKNQDKAVSFETDIIQEEEFIGDEFRLRVIISNLISNAIKYQNPQNGDPKVTVKIRSGIKSAIISISDNGIGILQEHLESIFKMFFRTPNTASKQGTGIGLFIVKEALEKIGGTINVNSTLFVGTTFEITVPNKKASQ
ncbi:MAG: hybrid sensor histidine kinase/response regulator [Bacteroidia bacterium]